MARVEEVGPEMAAPESRTEGLTVKVTPSERAKVKLVALVHGCDEGPMLRTRSLNEILAEADSMKARLQSEAA